jgi:hypothetical protein
VAHGLAIAFEARDLGRQQRAAREAQVDVLALVAM